MRISTNVSAMNISHNLGTTEKYLSESTRKLSSGMKISISADDAAGLAISEGMRAQIRGLNMGSKNSQDAISFIQTADGAMNDIHSMLKRARELCIQAASDVNADIDRNAIQEEITQISNEINHITDTTTFNTMYVFKEGSMNDADFLNNYGLGKVMGAKKVAQVDKLTEAFTFPSSTSGWTVSGSPSGIGVTGTAGSTYAATWLDFSGLGTDFQVSQLYEQGFNTTCATCNNHYSIRFVDASHDSSFPSTGYKYTPGTSHVLEVRVDDTTSGSALVDRIMDAVINSSGFTNHYTQYAVNSADPTKIYIYDNRTSTYTSANRGGSSTFELSVRSTTGDIISPSTTEFLWIQNGSNSGGGVLMEKPMLNSTMLGISGISVLSQSGAESGIGVIDSATTLVSTKQAKLGALQNRFEFSIEVNDISAENLQSAESRIRDADMAKEMTSLTRAQILNQAGTTMLAQANNLPQNVLQLIS